MPEHSQLSSIDFETRASRSLGRAGRTYVASAKVTRYMFQVLQMMRILVLSLIYQMKVNPLI